MKIKKIKFLLCITIITSLFGCTNENAKLNKTIVVSENVKEETELTLKIISKEKICFEEPVKGNMLYKDGQLILRGL